MSQNERAVFVRVTGRVQGVNFRNFVCGHGKRLGLTGWVVNRDDGAVEAAFHGPGAALGSLIELCRAGPSQAGVESIDVQSTDLGRVKEPPPDAYVF